MPNIDSIIQIKEERPDGQPKPLFPEEKYQTQCHIIHGNLATFTFYHKRKNEKNIIILEHTKCKSLGRGTMAALLYYRCAISLMSINKG